MGRIYVNQSSLKLIVKTYINLSGAEECLIKYRKPDGTEGSFTASIEDEQEGVLNYEIRPDDLNISGWWRFWAYIVFIGGKAAPGKSKKIFIWNEGE